MSDTVLEDTEADIFGILSATPSLALAKIIRADEGLTEADVAQSLVTMTGTEKIGLGIVVLPAEVVEAERNQPGPPLRISASCQVIEAVLINRGATGTGIKASVAALRALGALHHQQIGNRVLYAERNAVEPLPGKKGYVSYLVTLFSEANGSADVGRVRQLGFALDGDGDLVISTATAGAAIYYTTDGSFPGPSNDEATLYDGPVNITDDMTLRAAAFLSPLNPSDISEVIINITDSTVTLNGFTVTMGGEPILL
jgi:hypothetical protein